MPFCGWPAPPPAAVLLLAAALLALPLPASAAAPTYEVRGWSADWPRFEDALDVPGLHPMYDPACGTITASDASNGRIRLRGPQAPCNGVAMRPYVLLAGRAVVRAAFVAQSFPTGVITGIELQSRDGAYRTTLAIARGPLGGHDSVVVAFWDAFGASESATLTTQASSFLAALPRVELEFELKPEPHPATRAIARYRVCPNAGCAPGVPFTEVPPSSSHAALLPSDVSLGVFFFGQSNPQLGSPGFAVDLQDWEFEAGFDADLLGPGSSLALPYVTDCVATQFAADALTVGIAEACKEGVVGVDLHAPGTPSTRARFAFTMPPRCGASVGVGFGGSPGDPFPPDGALLAIARGPFPGIGSDALVALLLTESDAPDPQPQVPIALHVLAADAAAMTPPADGEIELRLSVIPGTSGEAEPRGEVRLCETSPCGSEAETPFQTLAPYTLPPDFRSCLDLDGSLTTPDGGAMPQPAPVGAVLYFAPEPGSALLAGAAASVLGGLAWSRARGRRAGRTGPSRR